MPASRDADNVRAEAASAEERQRPGTELKTQRIFTGQQPSISAKVQEVTPEPERERRLTAAIALASIGRSGRA